MLLSSFNRIFATEIFLREMVEEKKFWKRDEVQWFVLRLKWKPVEVLEELLKAEGKETFVPRSYVLRTDSRGRKHRVLKNVLPELLFVHASFDFLQPFVRTAFYGHGLTVSFCKKRENEANRVMVVPTWQMEPFIKATQNLSERILYHRADELELEKGVHVKLHGGPLDGLVGEVAHLKGKRKKRLVLRLMDFTAISVTTVEPEFIEVLPNT